MLSFFKNTFGKKNITVPKEDEFGNLSLDEMAVILSDSFAKFLKENCDFDRVLHFIEDPHKITPESIVWQMIISYNINPYEDKNISTDFEVRRILLNIVNKSTPETRIITFKMQREYNGLYDTRVMIGLILENGLLWFPKDLNERAFDHYNFTGYIKGCERYNFNNFHGSFSYIYNHTINNLSHIIEVPINHNCNQLNLRPVKNDNPPYNPNTMSGQSTDFFTYRRCYWLSFKINIPDESFAYKAIVTLSYRNEALRTMELNITNDGDFKYAIDRMLFPFNIAYEKLRELNLEKITLNDLENTFDDEFKVSEMMDV